MVGEARGHADAEEAAVDLHGRRLVAAVEAHPPGRGVADAAGDQSAGRAVERKVEAVAARPDGEHAAVLSTVAGRDVGPAAGPGAESAASPPARLRADGSGVVAPGHAG